MGSYFVIPEEISMGKNKSTKSDGINIEDTTQNLENNVKRLPSGFFRSGVTRNKK